MINFLLVNGWPALLRLTGYTLVTPTVVAQQITKNGRRATIRKAVAAGSLQLVDEGIPLRVLASFPDWVRRYGEQDASVLVNALALESWMGADDQGLCNEATRQGISKVVGTEWLLAEIVRQDHVSLAQGNRKLGQLRQRRYDSHVPCLCALCGVPCSCL